MYVILVITRASERGVEALGGRAGKGFWKPRKEFHSEGSLVWFPSCFPYCKGWAAATTTTTTGTFGSGRRHSRRQVLLNYHIRIIIGGGRGELIIVEPSLIESILSTVAGTPGKCASTVYFWYELYIFGTNCIFLVRRCIFLVSTVYFWY